MSTFRIKESGSLYLHSKVYQLQTLLVVYFIFSELYLKKERFRRIVLLPLSGTTFFNGSYVR